MSSDTLKLLKLNNGEVRQTVHLSNAVVSLTDSSPDSTPLTIADDENVETPQLCNEKPVAMPCSAENNVEAKVSRLEKQMEPLLSTVIAWHSKVSFGLCIDYQLMQLTLTTHYSKSLQVRVLNLRGCTHRDDADNRTLHLDCRKKIDELMIANHDLISKLKDTQNRAQLHEKRQRLFSEVLDKLKDTIMFFELSKAAEQLP